MQTKTVINCPLLDDTALSLDSEDMRKIGEEISKEIQRKIEEQFSYAMHGELPPIDSECQEVKPKQLMKICPV